MKQRIGSVGNTKKITEAMKLVAAAKVRRAQDAVINARPFSESLVKVLFAINTRLAGEDVEVPLCDVRPVKSVSTPNDAQPRLQVTLHGGQSSCTSFQSRLPPRQVSSLLFQQQRGDLVF